MPEGYHAVRFIAENVHHFAWSASPDYRYEGGIYARAVPRVRFPTWDTVAVHVLYKAGRRHVVGRWTRRRPNDHRASVARVHLGAVRVPAADERAPPRPRRHRVSDDDHGRVGVAGAHPPRGRPRLHVRNPRQQRVAVGMDGRGSDRAIRPTGRRSSRRRSARPSRQEPPLLPKGYRVNGSTIRARRTAASSRSSTAKSTAGRSRSERTAAELQRIRDL